MNKNHPHINIFIAYSNQDAPILEELQKQLHILERNKEIKIWYDGMVEAGKEWQAETDKAIAEAQIILLLVSSDFIASDKCYENQLQKALQKHKKGRTQVIPIIARPCLWEETDFGHLKALSLMTASDSKNEKDESYRKVAFALSNQVKDFRVVHKLQNRGNNKSRKASPSKLQNDLKKQIAKGNLEETMDKLSSIKNLDKDLNEAVILLSHRFYIWKREKSLELDTPDNLRIRKNLMIQALNLLIEDLPETIQIPKKQRSFFSFLSFAQNTTATETDAFAKEKDKIREYLIERYTERLRQKIDHRLPVSLQLTYTQEGTSPDYAHFSKDIPLSEPIEGTLTQTLQKHRHLLIIGNPGAGKTTQILELAKEWLTEKVDEKLPIVFNLASWKPQNQRFHEWLQQALVSGYGFSKKLAQEAILTNQILPFLDGLDEVGKDVESEAEQHKVRNACLQAIDDYLGLLEVEYVVICSRRKEYSEIEVNAPVKAEVLVNPLTPEQIKATLKDSLTQKLSTKDENAANTLLQLLEEKAVLEEVLCTPFYYNIALEVFDSRSFNQNLPSTKTELEEYLVEQFIEEKLRDTPNRKGFLKEKTLGYLGWIGEMMNWEGKVVFELVDLQPRHLESRWEIRLLGSFIAGFIGYLIEGISLYICVGLILGASINYHVKTNNVNNIRWYKLVRLSIWKNILRTTLFSTFALAFGTFCILLIGFGLSTSFDYQTLGLSFGISFVIGLFYGPILGVFFGITSELTKERPFYNTQTSYHNLKSEFLFKIFQLAIIISLAIMITFTISYYVRDYSNWKEKISVIFLIAIIFGFISNSLFKHFILRLCLFLEKKLPLQLVHFLRYTTQARMLEQDGGQWRFRHQILQDYFAEKWGGVNRNGYMERNLLI